MAVTINVLNAGNMTLGSGGSTPTARTATRVWYGNDENVNTDYEIVGGINSGDFDMQSPTTQIQNVTTAKKIEIGSTVTYIGYYAFMDCSFETIIIGDNVSRIEGNAFSNNGYLKNITFGNTINDIEYNAFQYCIGLTSITIPNNVARISDGVFNGCSSLKSVTFLGRTLEQVQNIDDGYGNKYYPWGISNTSIINVA